MKKTLLTAYALLNLTSLLAGHEKLSWHDARKAILKKAETIVKKYDPEICIWTTRTTQLLLSDEYDTQAWQLAKRVIEDIVPTLPVYRQVVENPQDDIFWQELFMQAMLIAGQEANQEVNSFEFGAKVGAIIDSYIDIFKKILRR